MQTLNYQLKEEEEFIPLCILLKVKQVAQTGGHAKIMIENGEVILNEEIELRKRKKIYKGDVVKIDNITITVS